ncbi:MAG: hypothetical protein QOJ92_2951 [Frankiales bacterium]|nr:hypothetical protein [Frankiales bacterium]
MKPGAALGPLIVLGCLGAAGGAVAAPAGTQVMSPASGSLGVRLVDRPTSAADDRRANLYVVDHLTPGSVIHRRIEVSNTTYSPMHVRLYSAAASVVNGGFAVAAGATQNELSTWTSIIPGALDLQAGQRATATVTVVVPAEATSGEHYGVAWAQVQAASSTAPQVLQVSRVGVRLYVSVGPGGSPAPDFTVGPVTTTSDPAGRAVVAARVHNTGGRALDLSGGLQLSAGPAGLSAGPFPARLGVTLGIGETETVRVDVDSRLPRGMWTARITLRSGLLERSSSARVSFADAVPSTPAAAARSLRPWLLGFVVLGFGLVGSTTSLRILRRRRGGVG